MLVHLEARGFRSLEPLSLELSPGSHLILGANGAGKTSLLEAVYLLATTRSFRTSRIADCCRHGESSFALAGEADTDRRALLEFRWSKGQRERSVNGCRTSLAEHLGALPVVCWTSNESEILVGSPEARRRFVDRGVLGLRPRAIDTFSRYRQALHEKRQLLRHGSGDLRTWNEVLAGAASDLIRLRAAYVERLGRAVRSILEDCSLGLGQIELHYRSSLRSGLKGSSAIALELMEASSRERAVQHPILGPHRDDLVIRWDGYEPRRVASAGERKALGLALLAAHGRILIENGNSGVYLLDDADTELDRGRLTALWSTFSGANQMLITSNRSEVWTSIGIDYRWECVDGIVQAR